MSRADADKKLFDMYIDRSESNNQESPIKIPTYSLSIFENVIFT